jgi:DNA-binding CsgD family transcriptional regulator
VIPAELQTPGPLEVDVSLLISELTGLALASRSRCEFRTGALGILARAICFTRATWQELTPRIVSGSERPTDAPLGTSAESPGGSARLRFELGRFGRTRTVLQLERDEGPFWPEEIDRLHALFPTLVLADEGAAGAPAPSRALSPREGEIIEYVRLGYTNAQIALATARSVAAVRNLLVRIFDKTGVRARAQLVGGALSTNGLTRREQQIVELLRGGLTNREIGRNLGIFINTVRNTLARLFEKVGVCTRSELMGALASDRVRAS